MALSTALKGPWHPLRVTGTPMPPSLLLMCKILVVAFLGTGHYRIFPDPFLPFIEGLDELVEPHVFRTGLKSVAVASALALLFNRWVRASALVLGSCFLIAVVSSKAYYGNNKTFVGLALVLAGLSDFDRPAYLLRWQLSLVYFGAALNKLLDPDWQSGQFFQYWAVEKLKNPVFIEVAERLPPLVAGKLMCWGTILAEFAVSAGLLLPRFVPCALWINVLFQVGLLEFTGSTYTLFFYGMLAATLAFATWPERLIVHCQEQRSCHRFCRLCMKVLDADRTQVWEPLPKDERAGRVEVLDRGKAYAGISAIARLLLYSAVFWLVLTAVIALSHTASSRRLIAAAVLAFFVLFWRPSGVANKHRSAD